MEKRYAVKVTYTDKDFPYPNREYMLVRGGYVQDIGDSVCFDDTYDLRTAKIVCAKKKKRNSAEVIDDKWKIKKYPGMHRIIYESNYEPIEVSTYESIPLF